MINENIFGNVVMYNLNNNVNVDSIEYYRLLREKEIPMDIINSYEGNYSRRRKLKLNVKDIRRDIVGALVKCGGVVMRKNGGAIFVPRSGMYIWKPLQEIFEKFGGVSFTSVEVASTDFNSMEIGKAILLETDLLLYSCIEKLVGVREHKKNKIADIVDEFAEAFENRIMKIDATHRMISMLENQKTKVEDYQRLLGKKVNLMGISENLHKAILSAELTLKLREEENDDEEW